MVVAALAVLTLLAWAYVLWLATGMAMPSVVSSNEPLMPDGMAGMNMGGISGMGSAAAPAFRPWSPADFVFTFAMWSVMMVGMMTPSVAPMVLLYAAVGRKAAESGAPFASTAWFLGGYFMMWTGFSALVTVAQWGLTSLALLDPMMAAASTILGGAVLVVVGIYQWTPLKQTCLRACQSPLAFLQTHGGFQSAPAGALRLGIAHGAYCLGCCVALMALLFVGGIMNILWIASLTILILLEKVVPGGPILSRISGALIGAAGLWLLIRAGA